MENKKTIFVNVRCRKCGQIISKEYPEGFFKFSNPIGVNFSSKSEVANHGCAYTTQQEEHVIADVVSWTDEPLEIATKVIYMKKENEDSKDENTNKD